MSNTQKRMRVFMTGVGGQGTLTATTMLARVAVDLGVPVTSGEIHGMAQRGGVVESAALFGGYSSPVVSKGEADALLGFEPLETLRALSYLKPGGIVVSNLDPMAPISVSMGRESYPPIDAIVERVSACAGRAVFLPCAQLAREAGSEKAANMVLLGAAAAAGALPFGLDELKAGVRKFLAPKIVDLNLTALSLGATFTEKALAEKTVA